MKDTITWSDILDLLIEMLCAILALANAILALAILSWLVG